MDRGKICTEVNCNSSKLMWTQIMKLPYTKVKFYPEVKSQTGLSYFGSHVNVLLIRKLTLSSLLNDNDIFIKLSK